MSETSSPEKCTCKCEYSRIGSPRRFQPTEEMRTLATRLAKEGLTHRQIAANIINPHTGNPIDLNTFLKYFQSEIYKGRGDSTKPIHANVYREALAGDKWAMRYWIDRTDRLEESESRMFEDLIETSQTFRELVERMASKKIKEKIEKNGQEAKEE